LEFDEKLKIKTKKRVKKIHRKAIIESVKEKIKNIEEKENQKLDKVQKACKSVVYASTEASKMALIGLSVYAIQMFANYQFNGNIPSLPIVEFLKNVQI
jgi:TRAP-type C4-dicarboxylate transport system substrate-binding protein